MSRIFPHTLVFVIASLVLGACSGESTSMTTPTPSGGDTTAPVIGNVTVTNVTATSATVTWTTNEASSTQVQYGTTTAYGSSVNGTANTTNHSVAMVGLAENTSYHYRVVSMDSAGNSATSGNATFTTTSTAPISQRLTVGVSGSGTVTSAPTGIDCGIDCTQDFDDGAQVVLTPNPTGNFRFSHWGGSCAGSGSCVVTMDATKNVMATFTDGTTVTLYEQGFEDWNVYSPDLHLTEGARAEHSNGWNGSGAVKMFLGTPADPSWAQYAGWQYFGIPQSLYQSDRIHVRWCVQFGPTILQAALDGGKLFITHRNTPTRDPNPRVMAFVHPYAATAWQAFSGNNVDNAPPNPPLFTLQDKIGQWMCLEVGVSQQSNTRQFWVTVQGGQEVLLQTEPLNRTDGIWTGGVEFGYWGPVSNVGPDSWWKLDELRISNTKIGPPAGFGTP